MFKFIDNSNEVVSEILRAVMDNAPRGMAPRYVHELTELWTSFNEGTAKTLPEGFFFTAHRAGTSVDFKIKFKEAGYRAKPRTDDEGNEWAEYQIEVEVNFPTHGSLSPAVAIARLEVQREFAFFAAELTAQFGKIVRMERTKAEVDEENARFKAARIRSDLAKTVREAPERKGLKVGAMTPLAAWEPNIPNGEYNDIDAGDKKTYQLVVNSGTVLLIRQT